jgi:hypothetical protein
MTWGMANKPITATKLGYPDQKEGSDGDIQIRQSDLGAKIFGKLGGTWYNAPLTGTAGDPVTRIGVNMSNHLSIDRDSVDIFSNSVKVASFGANTLDNLLKLTHNDTTVVEHGAIFNNTISGIHIAKSGTNDGAGSMLKFSADGDTNQAAIAHIAANTSGDASLAFYTSDAVDAIVERMRIDNTGQVGIGENSPDSTLHVENASTSATLAVAHLECTNSNVGSGDRLLWLDYSADADVTDAVYIAFEDQNTVLGVIKAADAAVVVDSYSDYRLKDDITTLSGGLDRVNNLRPVTFTYKAQRNKDNLHESFVAHEVQEHIPYAVRGEKDAVKDDGEIEPQSFCIYQLIPQLVSAIQELSAKLDTMQIEINNLKLV